MNAISTRLRPLKQRFMPADDPAGERLVAELRARMRRVAEAIGEPYGPSPPDQFGDGSVVEILRSRFPKIDRSK
jgi:hypothetical protein